jgi:cystathionine beta-synthase
MAHPRRFESVLDAIGQTPMVRLNRVAEGLAARGQALYAKLDFLNPMGSSKDRIARHMVERAEADGRLRPGDLLIENSSGNTAMGLALLAIQKGYRLRAVVRDRTSREKLDQLRALGVDVQKVDSCLPPGHPDSYNNITPRLAKELPDCYFPDQHNNRENNETHYLQTGPEIWEQMEGRVDAFVAGMGTGGTIAGVGRFLKERNPNVRIVAVDVEGSVFAEYFRTGTVPEARPYLLEGLGDEFVIGTADFSNVDDVVQVSDRTAFLAARELARREGLLAGGSSGAAMHVALRVAAGMPEGSTVVTLLPDGASRYLSTIYSDDWMRGRGFI